MNADQHRWERRRVTRAALLATIGAGLMSVAPLLEGARGFRTFALISAPYLAWCAFYVAVARSPERLKPAAILVLAVAIPARLLLLVAYISSAVDLMSSVVVIADGLATAGWALLLITRLVDLRKPSVETTASVLAMLVVLANVNEILLLSVKLLSVFDAPLVFWRNNPLGKAWSAVLAPVVRLFWIATQVYFLRTLATAEEPRTAWGAL